MCACTHTSLCRFLLQLFISPCHFEACSCLPVSHLFLLRPPLVLHFQRFCLPSSFLPVSGSSSLSTLCSESVIKYFIMSLWTKWNVALPSSCTFFFLPLLLLHHSGWFYLLSPACNLTVTPNSLYSCFSLLHFQVDWTPVVIFKCSSYASSLTRELLTLLLACTSKTCSMGGL